MSANFSACARCGVRLSAPSMAYHQQLCGKPTSVGVGKVRVDSTMANFAVAPLDAYSQGHGTPTSYQRGRMDRAELNALREEVYSAGRHSVPAHPRGSAEPTGRVEPASWSRGDPREVPRRRDDSSGGFHPSDGEGYSAYHNHHHPQHDCGRSSSGGGGVGGGAVPPPAAQPPQQNVQPSHSARGSARVEELVAALEDHVQYCRGEFLHLENLTARQKLQRADDQAAREEMRRMADELLLLRRDFKDIATENERLRDEVRKLKAERSVVAADPDFMELRAEVTRMKAQYENIARESYNHLREMRTLREECTDEIAAAKREVRGMTRDIEALREDLVSIRRRTGDAHSAAATASLSSNGAAVTAAQMQPTASAPPPLSSGPVGNTARPTNISLTVQHHGASLAHSRRAHGATPRVERSASGGDYISVDDGPSRRSLSGPSVSHTVPVPVPVPSAMDSSMRRDTEVMVTKALQQQKRPAAVVSSRSLSRGGDDGEQRGRSTSPEQHAAPVAHVTLR